MNAWLDSLCFNLYLGLALPKYEIIKHTQPNSVWLNDHAVDWHRLFMRKDGDDRCDTIIKEEIFWEEIAPYYNVIAAFDDRPKILRKWTDIGIPLVIGVQKGYGEF